jgi:hypothetical protein
MESESVRQLELFDEALAESERARAELLAANERLRRSNADLRRVQRHVAEGFAVLDERTDGRLRELVEQAGDELAALVDRIVDRRDGDV